MSKLFLLIIVIWRYNCLLWIIISYLFDIAASNIKLVIVAAPYKAAAVWPPAIHHENYQN